MATYTERMSCTNCGWYGYQQIPRGVTIGGSCPRCGCWTLVRAPQTRRWAPLATPGPTKWWNP